jgi:Tfp pilus assembly protein PilF
MRAYFGDPVRGRSSAWELSDAEAQSVFSRLGGKQGDKGNALPLAMVLLGQVAEGMSSSPIEVLQRHPERLNKRLEEMLFHDLYDNVLSDSERRVLQLCALYRTDIPDLHVDQLNQNAQDFENRAFDRLKMRCLLNFDAREEWYSLHQVIRDLTLGRSEAGSEQFKADHSAIGEAWLSRLKFGSRPTLPNILAASEAAYHLTRAERFDRLGALSGRLIRRDLIPYLALISQQLHSQARYKEDRRLLELLVAIDPDDQKSLRFLGETIEAIDGKGAAAAREHYATAYRLNPGFAPHVANFALWLVANGERGAALNILNEADQSGTTNDHLRNIRGRILQAAGEGEAAAALRQQLIQSGSRDPIFYNDEAVYLRDKGQFTQALDVLDLAEKRGITDDYLLAIRASIFQATGEGQQATALRQQLIQSDSRNPVFYNDEAVYLRDNGQFTQALDVLDIAEKRGITDDHLLAVRASILQAMGERHQATALRQQLIQSGSRDPVFYNDEAVYLRDKGQFTQALGVLDIAENRGIKDDYSLSIRASILQATGEGQQATALRQQRIQSGSRNPAFYNDEAIYLRDEGQFTQALGVLDIAEKRGILDDYSLSIRASILQATGHEE